MTGFNLADEIIKDAEILSSKDFSQADVVAVNTNFKNVKISDFTITSIHMNVSHFRNCSLHNVYVSGGKGGGVVRGCTFSDVHFSRVSFADILFEKCRFEGCSFRDIRFGLISNRFINCGFSHCDLPKDNSSFFYMTLKERSHIDESNTFSQCTGWASPSEFLARNFERNEANTGYIVYKTFGHLYTPPKEWAITPGSIITENCDLNRMVTCSYGINVATLEWMRNNIDAAHQGIHRDPNSPNNIWRCEILDEWLADVCVPIGSDGKIRCGKLKLIEVIETI